VAPLGHHHRGAAAERVGREATAVLLEAGDGHEERARGGLARVVGEAGHASGRRAQYRLVRQRVEERGGGHLVVAHGLTAGSSPRSPRRGWAGRWWEPGAGGTRFPRAAARRARAAGSS